MKDLYQALGLTKDATLSDIKNAYRKAALASHPDRGGNAETMILLNEAYEKLSDPVARQKFDADYQSYQQANIVEPIEINIEGHLPAGNTPPFSQKFKQEHSTLVYQYRQKPLTSSKENAAKLEPLKAAVYTIENTDNATNVYPDIYTLLNARTAQAHTSKTAIHLLQTPLSPTTAVNLLTEFLTGNYFANELDKIIDYLQAAITDVKNSDSLNAELQLYEGIYEILAITKQSAIKQNQVLSALKKITDFSKQTSELTLQSLLPLFYNRFFRHLYAQALHDCWENTTPLFVEEILKQFDGRTETKELLNVLRERLSTGNSSKGLGKLIRYIKLLYQLENDLQTAVSAQPSASDYRNKAFHLLDWMPALLAKADKQILVNIFLQIGIHFQQAARLESEPAVTMADEQTALQMYLTAVSIAQHATPDVEIYANSQALQYILHFQFHDATSQEAIPALQKRVLAIADMFPFFQGIQSNTAFLRQENKTLHLMRRMLNSMIQILDHNKKHPQTIELNHSSVAILYQAYEACLKNWYQEEHDPVTEEKFRLELMEELLFEKGWTFLDVEQNLTSPYIMVDRDSEDWLTPTRSLPYRENSSFDLYRTINGAELNYTTGEITFFMDVWQPSRPVYEKTFTLFDLEQIIQKDLTSAIFSLDPVDPNKPYHPFNAMRFAPPQVCDSELLNTMLLTDYILKFLTTGQEVQGAYPFQQRSVEMMLQHLPAYLRKIIDDFRQASRSGATHRFWIEAEEIAITFPEETLAKENIARIGLGNIRMVVKKHLMERDINGELKDVGDENEGWPIYVLNAAQFEELQQNRRHIQGRAMIFISGETQLFYWENNQLLHYHKPQNFRDNLIRLYRQPRTAEGKIEANAQNSALLYRCIRIMAEQTGQPQHFSAEYLFAYQFTTHYNEFAQYLPEFGRLRELSKITTLIRFLDGLRKSNKQQLEALEFLTTDSPGSQPSSATFADYNDRYQKSYSHITSVLNELGMTLSTDALRQKWQTEINRIAAQIGELNLSRESKEVKDIQDKLHQQIARNNPRAADYQIREAVKRETADLPQQMTETKQKNVREQLNKLFEAELKPSLGFYGYQHIINTFLKGDSVPLIDALVDHESVQAQNELAKQFSTSSAPLIKKALNGQASDINRLAQQQVRQPLLEEKAKKARVAAGFERIGFGKHKEAVDVSERCFWVPASVNHQVDDVKSSESRHSFFVYGGVRIQPNVRLNNSGGGGPLGGNPIGSGAFNRTNITRGFQSHHIISPTNAHTKNHPLLKLAGITNMDARFNRIFLPKHESQHPTRSIHNGRHSDIAMQKVADKMTNIVNIGKAQNWSQAQYNAALRTMLSEERQNLRKGNVALNSTARPWAK